jgi:hypothetical protein
VISRGVHSSQSTKKRIWRALLSVGDHYAEAMTKRREPDGHAYERTVHSSFGGRGKQYDTMDVTTRVTEMTTLQVVEKDIHNN